MNGKRAKDIRKKLGIDVRTEHKPQREIYYVGEGKDRTAHYVTPWTNPALNAYRTAKRNTR